MMTNTTDACETRDPCQHGGICISTDSGPICECRTGDYEGAYCEKGMLLAYIYALCRCNYKRTRSREDVYARVSHASPLKKNIINVSSSVEGDARPQENLRSRGDLSELNVLGEFEFFVFHLSAHEYM